MTTTPAPGSGAYAALIDEIEAARRCLADADRFLDGDSIDYGFADAYDTAAMLADALRSVLAALDEEVTE